MNTVQTASSNQDKVSSIVRNQRNEKRKESEFSTENASKQANSIKKKEQSSLAAKKNPVNETDNKDKDKLEINDYLKIVSRLENKLNLGQLEDKDLDKISTSLEEKILSLKDSQKTRLISLPFFKKNGIENIKDLKETLFELFKDVGEREALFDFLKSPEFMSMLLNESDKPFTYSASLTPISGNSAKIQV